MKKVLHTIDIGFLIFMIVIPLLFIILVKIGEMHFTVTTVAKLIVGESILWYFGGKYVFKKNRKE